MEMPQCACLKNECLQRYCRCFLARLRCSDKCTCRGCRNTEENNALVEERVEKIMTKSGSDAFMIKTTRRQVDAAGSVVTEQEEMVRGCTCRKSECKKRLYCVCYKHKVGCGSTCRCTGCANTYGAKAEAYETDEDKVDGNGSRNEIVLRDSRFSSLPVSEEEEQMVNDNVGHNGTYIGSPQFSSLPESEEDRQKVNDITNPNEILGGSQSFSLPSFEEHKVNNDNDISNETPRGSSGALAGSNIETSPLSDDEYMPPEVRKMLDDILANPDSYYAAADPQSQSLDDNIFDDTLYQPLGDGYDFQHNIDPPTYQEYAPQVDELPLTTCQGFAQADESQLKTCQGFAQADESQLKTCQGFAQADESQLKISQGFAQADESQLKTCQGFAQADESQHQIHQDIMQPDESQLQTDEESAQADDLLLNNSKDSSNLHTVNIHNDSQNNTGEGDH